MNVCNNNKVAKMVVSKKKVFGIKEAPVQITKRTIYQPTDIQNDMNSFVYICCEIFLANFSIT